MQDLFGSVRRSLVFRPTNGAGGGSEDGGFSGFVDKIGSSIRKSRFGLLGKASPPALPTSPLKENMPPLSPQSPVPRPSPPTLQEDAPPFRWRKGELIGSGAFGRVYMGMNLDSGELLAVKQVCLPARGASNAKTQAYIKELEDEVKLLKNLSHPNIVRYLGTARDAEALNILLEFVPGGSIHSLLEKFESFPESVIREYTKQLLLGLEYLHKNGIMHRDIKGANILVDNKACIKLADFGASKKVVELATIGAKSMKGTPFWMAPEVIRQTGHSFSADIWSVGCTVIEMATGKPPWVDQHQDACMAAALYHIGSARTPPPIPENLSAEAKDFLLKCFQLEPSSRASASDLLQHPFVTGENRESQTIRNSSAKGSTGRDTLKSYNKSLNGMRTISGGLKEFCNLDSLDCHKSTQRVFNWDSNADDDDDMCQIDDDFVINSCKLSPPVSSPLDDLSKSFNPMSEPNDDWSCKFDESEKNISGTPGESSGASKASCTINSDFTFPHEPLGDEDDEVTESKIRAFLDEKALDLKKLQTPLYRFYNTLNTPPPCTFADVDCTDASNRSPSPHRAPSRRLSTAIDAVRTASPGNNGKQHVSDDIASEETLKEVPEWKEAVDTCNQGSIRSSDSERRKKWKEELDEELKRQREMMRHARRGR